MKPYYQDVRVTLYHGRAEEIVPELHLSVDAAITDPPYGETSLAWDRWPREWPQMLHSLTRVLWCFGSLRMFMDKQGDFAGWRLAQDVVWEKHNGSSLQSDRFRRVHEVAAMFYTGEWASLYKLPPTMAGEARGGKMLRRHSKPQHFGGVEQGTGYRYGETRIMRSVIPVHSCHRAAVHPTQKPEGIVLPLIAYSVPLGGTLLDLFAGSGTSLVAAKNSGRNAVGIECEERFCEATARRLSQELAFA